MAGVMHTKTELRGIGKTELIDMFLTLEARYAESERECWELRERDQFPAEAPPCESAQRRAERFIMATARSLAFSYRNVDTTIPAVSRAVVNHLREAVRQYDQAIAEITEEEA